MQLMAAEHRACELLFLNAVEVSHRRQGWQGWQCVLMSIQMSHMKDVNDTLIDQLMHLYESLLLFDCISSVSRGLV